MGSSLYNPLTTIEKQHKLDRPYKGKVVFVDDDKMFGRIKVSIPELYGEYEEKSETESTAGILPWIYPRFTGSMNRPFCVPDLGEIVEVIFPYKNIYLGYYTNVPLMGPDKLSGVFKTANYPNVYGDLDRNGTGWYIDKVTDTITFVQGTTQGKATWDSEGTLTFDIPKNMIMNVADSMTLNVTNTYTLNATDVKIVASGTINEEASGSWTAKSPTNTIDGNTKVIGNLDVTQTVTATVDCIGGGISLKGHIHSAPHYAGNTSSPIGG